MTDYVFITRAVSGDRFTGAIGRTRFLAIDGGRDPIPGDEIAFTVWLKGLLAGFPRDAEGRRIGHIVIFVHGYNVAPADMIARHRQLQAGIAANGLAATVISFDWPSEAKTYAYLDDLDDAKATAVTLVNDGVRRLLNAQTKDCAITVHTVCHSMGAFVVREALSHADDGITTGGDWLLGQLVMIAGDVDADQFLAGVQDTDRTLGHSVRVTNYFNRKDEALQVSNVKRAGTSPRVGRVGLPEAAPQKMVNIDATGLYDRTPAPGLFDGLSWSHSWYFSNPSFLTDLTYTLKGNFDRTAVPGRTPGPGRTLLL